MPAAILTSDDLAELAGRLAVILDDLNVLSQEADSIKATIRAGVPGPDTYAAGNLSLVVAANTRFDGKAALKIIPDAIRSLVVTRVEQVDGSKLRILAPAVWEAACTSYEHKVSVR